MLIQRLDVYKDYLFLKFQDMITAASLDAGDFVIRDEDGNEIPNALQPLNVERDYNRISRSVKLYFADIIDADTNYTLRVQNINNILGEPYATVDINFKTQKSTGDAAIVAPIEPNFYVEDHTVANVSFPDTGGGGVTEPATPNTYLEVVGSNPIADSIFNTSPDDEYAVDIILSEDIDLADSDEFITVQKRKLAYTFTQWEDISIDELPAETSSKLEFVVPSDGDNYQYRVIINKALRSSDDEFHLEDDYVLRWTSVLTPFYSNPEEIISFYPDTSEVEAAVLIHRFSMEVQSMMGWTVYDDPSFLAVEYVTTAVLCHLAKLTGEIMGANGNADDVTLGDFRVSRKTGGNSGASSRATRDSATNWCELASAIKRELRAKNRLPRTFVRGSRHKNPIPSRYFKDLETFKNRNNPSDYGMINDD